MSDYEFTVSLRIRHPNIDPAEITQMLGFEPQHTWRAGDARRSPTGEALEGIHRESYWMGRLLESPQLSTDRVSVESVLSETLSQLRRSFDFVASMNAEGAAAELYISIYAREAFRLELSSESLALFGRLGLTISLEVHPHPHRAD
jgi:hypothetical protein